MSQYTALTYNYYYAIKPLIRSFLSTLLSYLVYIVHTIEVYLCAILIMKSIYKYLIWVRCLRETEIVITFMNNFHEQLFISIHVKVTPISNLPIMIIVGRSNGTPDLPGIPINRGYFLSPDNPATSRVLYHNSKLATTYWRIHVVLIKHCTVVSYNIK